MGSAELVTVTTTIEEYSKTEHALAELAQRYKDVRYDVDTKDGLKAATEARAQLRNCRIELEKIRVKIKAPALKRTQEIDTEARRLTAAISSLEDPIDAQIKAEEKRKEDIKLAAERAEAARIEAEEQAKKDAYEKQLAEERAELDRRQAAIALAEQERIEKERGTARLIEEQERSARLRIEEEERKARAVRDEQDRLARIARDEEERKAREVREAEEQRLKAERDKLEAAQREIDTKARLAREEEERKARLEREEQERKDKIERDKEEARLREEKRMADDILDANALLTSFVNRFGDTPEFATVVKAIRKHLASVIV